MKNRKWIPLVIVLCLVALTIYAATFTGNVTLSGSTANTIIEANGSQSLVSVPNTAGNTALTNDGVGDFGWFPLASIAGGGSSFQNLNNTNLTVWPSNSPALMIRGPVQGLSTNTSLGEVWATEYGFSPTNSAAGNDTALDLAINQLTNIGGGILRYGGRYSNSPSVGQTINIAKEHLFPVMVYPSRIKLQGDGTTVINYTGATTTNGVLFGQFDAESVLLTGPRTTNVTDVYPYTNLVGILEVGFWDPQLRNCYASGFGQGFAFDQLGSFRGSTVIGCHSTGNDIGFAVGNQCDYLEFLGSDGRKCLWGIDIGCLTPCITNNNYFPGMVAPSTGTTNIVGTHYLHVEGGIWDGDHYASCVIGKGTAYLSYYAGLEHNYQLIINHPTNIITTVPYQNEGSPTVVLDHCSWLEVPVTTNIWISPVLNAAPSIEIRHSPIGLGGYGIIGVPGFVLWDQLSLNAGGGTNLWFGSPTVGAFNFNKPDEKYSEAPQTTDEFYDEPNGAYANSTIIKRIGYHISTSEVSTPLEIGFYAGDMTTRAALDLHALGGNQYSMDLNGIGITTTGTNSGMWGAFTNNLYAPFIYTISNSAPLGFTTNITPAHGVHITNTLGAFAKYEETAVCTACGTGGTTGIASFNVTNSIGNQVVSNNYGIQINLGTNTQNVHWRVDLGPGDWFMLGTNVVGQTIGSQVTFNSGQMTVIP